VGQVGERIMARQAPAAMGTVGQVGEGRLQLQLKPPLLGVPADGLVAARLVRLAVSADEEACSFPLLSPLRPGESRLLEMVAAPGKAASSPAHRHPGLREAGFNVSQPSLEDLETALLLEALGAARIPSVLSPALTNRHAKAPLD